MKTRSIATSNKSSSFSRIKREGPVQKLNLKALNLIPCYEDLVRNRSKHTSLRLGDQTSNYSVGDRIDIRVGWNSENGSSVSEAIVTSICLKRIGELVSEDLYGESPDCLRPEAVKYVLSAIYRRVLDERDLVTIISWRYIE